MINWKDFVNTTYPTCSHKYITYHCKVEKQFDSVNKCIQFWSVKESSLFSVSLNQGLSVCPCDQRQLKPNFELEVVILKKWFETKIQ